ncbi:SIMPL domain-containing protein [Colwelliaceae bacterium 6471]
MKLLIKIILLVFPLSAQAISTQPEGIEVTGKAEISATPDIFIVEMDVIERGASAAKIKNLVDYKSKQIVKAARAIGVKENEIQSARVNIRPIYEEPSIVIQGADIINKFPDGTRGKVNVSTESRDKSSAKVTIEVSRRIKINLFDLTHYDQLLDSVTKIGVSRIYPLSMSISKAGQLYQQALDQAIMDAKQKATRIAAQAGVSLGKLSYMKEISYGAPSALARASDFRAEFQSSAGQERITAQVLATYSINP